MISVVHPMPANFGNIISSGSQGSQHTLSRCLTCAIVKSDKKVRGGEAMRHRVMPWIAGVTIAIITMPAAVSAQAAQPHEITILESTPGFFDLPLRNAIADFAPKLNLDVKLITVTGGGGLAVEFEGGT